MQTPLDPDTYQRLHDAWAMARTRGFDPFEEMNRRKLILTPRVGRDILLGTLGNVQQQLGLWRPVELLRLAKRTEGASSPKDMLDAVNMFLEQYIDHWRKEPL